MLRHHSVVELVDRASSAGLVRRQREDEDHRVVRVRLTADGEERIETLSLLHLEELRRLAPVLASPRAPGGARGGAASGELG